MKLWEYFLCTKEKKQQFYSTIRLLRVTLVPFWRVSAGRKQRMLFCVSCITPDMFPTLLWFDLNENNVSTWRSWHRFPDRGNPRYGCTGAQLAYASMRFPSEPTCTGGVGVKAVSLHPKSVCRWWVFGETRPDQQVPERHEETKSSLSEPCTLLVSPSGAYGIAEGPFWAVAFCRTENSVNKDSALNCADFHQVGRGPACIFSHESCLEFGPADSHVILRPRPGYVPKVPTTPFRDQVLNLEALPTEEADPALALLCPVRALRIYVDLYAEL